MSMSALPETDSADSAKYLVHSRYEIIALLRAIIDCRALVTVYFNQGRDSLVTNLLSVNPDFEEVVFDIGSQADANRRLLGSNALTVVTFVDHVKIQFSTQRAEQTAFEGKPALRLRLPQSLLRLQRREHYRLSPPVTNPIKCIVSQLLDRAGKPVEYRIVDISCGGVGLLVEPHQMRPELGRTLKDCRIDLAEIGPVNTGLVIRNTVEIPGRVEGQRYGCQFVDIPGTHVNLIQRYINNVQRERRARGS
jgi:flagellar brake protein